MPRKNKQWRSEYQREWYLAHRDEQVRRMREYRRIVKDEVFAAYGGYKCVCCGELGKHFLSIDHIEGGGNEHRRKIGRKSGIGFLYWLKKNGFPPGYQVLCYNCNLGRAFGPYNGICPHKIKE